MSGWLIYHANHVLICFSSLIVISFLDVPSKYTSCVLGSVPSFK